jgi:predicted lipoprotein with Yx(FWY)xxD motif
MISPLTGRSAPVRRYRRHVVVASTLALCGMAALTACGKSVSITDDASSSAPPSASAAGTPQTAAASQPAQGNDALQVLDTTAQQAGKTGTGGTVVGVAAQKAPPTWVQLSAVTSPPLNAPHLININQAALYRWDGDSAKPSTSRCTGDCAAKWPPVTIQDGGNVYLAGVNAKEVGAIKREDGTVQVTVGGWPVYRFAKDSKPGDLKGQGIDGTWFAVGPKGEKVEQH